MLPMANLKKNNTEAGAAANKITKYDELFASMHIFYPVSIETGGLWNHWAVELVQEIGRRATIVKVKVI